ncbi:fimbrial chaperone protein FimC, partial [Salmonella enterica subsp. enterica serovar Heidelberg str. CFSAN002075]
NVQAAGGIALGATRVIYPSAAKQTSLAISNSDTQERYLVNSWIVNNVRRTIKQKIPFALSHVGKKIHG